MIIGQSINFSKTFDKLNLILSQKKFWCFLNGDIGTGKMKLTKYILKQFPDQPILIIDCDQDQKEFEDSFFGTLNQPGKIEIYNNGFLVLQNIDQLNLVNQLKFYQVLNDGYYYKNNSSKKIEINFNLIVHSSVSLVQQLVYQLFRKDLLEFLDIHRIDLPKLKDRGDDVVLLSKYFLNKLNKKYKKGINYSKGCDALLLEQDWKYNIDELKNVLERAYFLNSPNDILQKESLNFLYAEENIRNYLENLKKIKKQYLDENKFELRLCNSGVKKEVIDKAFWSETLKISNWKLMQAARKAGFSTEGARTQLKRYGLLEKFNEMKKK